MRKVFARTKNVMDFTAAMSRLHSRQEGIPGMALVYGEPGLGKTRTIMWWIGQNDGVFIRTKKLMTGRWLLEEIVAELGQSPVNRISDLFRQCRDMLLDKPRTIFVDEIDYLAHDSRVIETLRDIHDDTNSPIVFIGMGEASRKMQKYKHLYDRFSTVLEFTPLTKEDVAGIIEQMCEVKVTEEAAAFIHKDANRFRKLILWMYRMESHAKTNSKKEIDLNDVQTILKKVEKREKS
ncbi:MAG: ATP-binding protein [Candidatus Magnetominusculus sp. LBB02]|nr:ATP-binding protein [Candidatus Magnetominusculus sp. LBB02]